MAEFPKVSDIIKEHPELSDERISSLTSDPSRLRMAMKQAERCERIAVKSDLAKANDVEQAEWEAHYRAEAEKYLNIGIAAEEAEAKKNAGNV